MHAGVFAIIHPMNKPAPLLSRDEFRSQVLARNGGLCVFCTKPAVDAHHIIERRLWPDGGYYLDNGAGVCAEHHMACERTEISLEEVREACGIRRVLVPPHLYPDHRYDKWGNHVLANGQRVRGELFADASVQKVLSEGKVLDLFAPWVKYPRTHHLPWSEGLHDDDRLIHDLAELRGHEVVVTEKMDGENTTLYTNYMHARSVDGNSHPSRGWVKGFWSRFAADIPENWRVCGENLYAKHSIAYPDLPTYFMGFSIWDDKNVCLSWDDTLEWFTLLGITPVPVLYRGIYDEKKIKALWDPKHYGTCEGYVVRRADAISYGGFRTQVGKFVRKGHVQTATHWRHGQPIVPNGLLTAPK
jgi:hypothetical protein